MVWWELLIVTLSPIAASFLTFLGTILVENYKLKKEFNSKQKIAEQERLQNKAKDLKRIISPVIYSFTFKDYIDDPKAFKNNFLLAVDCRQLNNDKASLGCIYDKLDADRKHGDNTEFYYQIYKTLLLKENDIIEFALRYFVNKNDIDIEKLNADIQFINDTLGLNIELIKPQD